MDELRKQLEENTEEAEFALMMDDYLNDWGESLHRQYEKAKQRGEAPEMPEDMKSRLRQFIANYDSSVDQTESFDLRRESAGKTIKVQSTRRVGKWLRRFGVAAATIAILVGTLFTVQAVGVDVFGSIAKWTDSIIHYQRSIDTKDKDSKNTPLTEKMRYALLSQDLSNDYAPTWLPEEFELMEFNVDSNMNVCCISVYLQSPDDNWIIIEISYIKNNDAVYVEKSGNAEVFDANGRLFYIVQNSDTIIATWSNGVESISVYGLIDFNTLKRILGSIGGNTNAS